MKKQFKSKKLARQLHNRQDAGDRKKVAKKNMGVCHCPVVWVLNHPPCDQCPRKDTD